MKNFLLIILDGYGLNNHKEGNAAALSDTPNLDMLSNNYPKSTIETSGKFVGLPDNVMGNSEVGHMNIGAGRIVKQDLVRINEDIVSNQLKKNIELIKTFDYVKANNSTLHIMGLLSDGAVHSHINHFKYILKSAKYHGVKLINIHVFTDGRDTPPDSAINFMSDLENYLKELGLGLISTICGRYYAMDRDKRWDRNELAYRVIAYGEGEKFSSAVSSVNQSYENGISDEFIKPKVNASYKGLNNKDAIFCMNFRADRMRQISKIFTDRNFDEFKIKKLDIMYVSMTKYQEDFKFPSLYSTVKLSKIFPEILSNNGMRQLRIAETEKYAHVTYFFNGGNEKKFDGEDRILIPSPKVSTYDLQPEMSAYELTDEIINAMNLGKYESIIINYANPDMVGHTGNLDAAIKAIESVDICLGKLINYSSKLNYTIFLTADHGNLEMMVDSNSKSIHTAHTTLPVPLYMFSTTDYNLSKKGKLADIAPTILDYLEIKKPTEMSGESLLIKK